MLIFDLATNLSQCPAKEAKLKFVKSLVTMLESVKVNTKQNNDRSNNQSPRFTGNKKKSISPPSHR